MFRTLFDAHGLCFIRNFKRYVDMGSEAERMLADPPSAPLSSHLDDSLRKQRIKFGVSELL